MSQQQHRRRRHNRGRDQRRPICERAEGSTFGAARAAQSRRRGQGRPLGFAHRAGQVAPARIPAPLARLAGAQEQDHADAQADQRDQEVRLHGQSADDPGRSAQEARVRQAGSQRGARRRSVGGTGRGRCRTSGGPGACSRAAGRCCSPCPGPCPGAGPRACPGTCAPAGPGSRQACRTSSSSSSARACSRSRRPGGACSCTGPGVWH